MTIENDDELAAMKRIGQIVALTMNEMARRLCPGMTTAELDAIGRDMLAAHGARSAPRLMYGFPGDTCISINDEAAHGVPSPRRRIQAGDLVNIDVSAELDGFFGDTGGSFPVGEVAPKVRALCAATRAALSDGIAAARAGKPLWVIGKAVQARAKSRGFHVIRNLTGHGIGRRLHESPSVFNTFDSRSRQPLWEGLVITIEPFLSTRATYVEEAGDGWTLRTPDGSLPAQFEHTMVITKDQPILLTQA
jgi:methionyl aminopeptidase